MDSDAQIIPNVGTSNDHSDNAQEKEEKRKKTHTTISNISGITHQSFKKTGSVFFLIYGNNYDLKLQIYSQIVGEAIH